MVYIYWCQACEKGDHANCDIGTPMAKGCVSGGSKCRCGCNGDPDWNSPQRLQADLQKLMESIINHQEVSKKANLVVGRPKDDTQDVSSQRPEDGKD